MDVCVASYLGPFMAIWGHLWPDGAVWDHLGPYGVGYWEGGEDREGGKEEACVGQREDT